MNFKEALIAHLQGEKVEARLPGSPDSGEWDCFVDARGDWNFTDGWKLCLLSGGFGEYAWEFRLAPRTITVNGVEVPAPEKAEPVRHSRYFVPNVLMDQVVEGFSWLADENDKQWLDRGLVYLNKEDAIARAKAMLITS